MDSYVRSLVERKLYCHVHIYGHFATRLESLQKDAAQGMNGIFWEGLAAAYSRAGHAMLGNIARGPYDASAVSQRHAQLYRTVAIKGLEDLETLDQSLLCQLCGKPRSCYGYGDFVILCHAPRPL
jgi:hypothetical protein